jgi:hypothetical protein
MQTHNAVPQAHGKGGRRALKPSEEQEIAWRVAAGEKKCDLADEFGIHRNTVPHILRRHPEVKTGTPTGPAAATATAEGNSSTGGEK